MKIEPGQIIPRVNGDVSLYMERGQVPIIGELGVQFTEVNGPFYVADCSISSLKGFPSKITGQFTLNRSAIGDFKNGPVEVGSLFMSRNSNLKSLEGFPKIIRGSVSIDSCPITSLEHLPKNIKGDLSLTDIMGPLSFVNGPEEVEGDLMILGSVIDTLDGFPKEVYGNVSFIGNLRPDSMPYEVSAREIRNICRVSGSVKVH